MVEKIFGHLYTFQVPLPENPLKWLNTYVVLGQNGGRNLLIDTGFRRKECLDAILTGFSELEIDPNNTDIFLTHVHSDHIGNAAELQGMGCRIIMSSTDYQVYLHGTWPEKINRVISEGMPSDILEIVIQHNPATLYAPGNFTAKEVEDGDILSYGGMDLECIHTPGHTPGHMCLYHRKSKTMLLGDHVLFDITPNICFWPEMENSLARYLKSLKRINEYEVNIALPGHRTTGKITMQERVTELQKHHALRLQEAESIIRKSSGITAYEIAGKMSWKIRCKDWDDFPPGQKWFAMGETLAHLDLLVSEGRVRRYIDKNKMIRYTSL